MFGLEEALEAECEGLEFQNRCLKAEISKLKEQLNNRIPTKFEIATFATPKLIAEHLELKAQCEKLAEALGNVMLADFKSYGLIAYDALAEYRKQFPKDKE